MSCIVKGGRPSHILVTEGRELVRISEGIVMLTTGSSSHTGVRLEGSIQSTRRAASSTAMNIMAGLAFLGHSRTGAIGAVFF